MKRLQAARGDHTREHCRPRPHSTLRPSINQHTATPPSTIIPIQTSIPRNLDCRHQTHPPFLSQPSTLRHSSHLPLKPTTNNHVLPLDNPRLPFRRLSRRPRRLRLPRPQNPRLRPLQNLLVGHRRSIPRTCLTYLTSSHFIPFHPISNRTSLYSYIYLSHPLPPNKWFC